MFNPFMLSFPLPQTEKERMGRNGMHKNIQREKNYKKKTKEENENCKQSSK